MIGSAAGVALGAARGHVAVKPSNAASSPEVRLNDGQVFFASAICLAIVLVLAVCVLWFRTYRGDDRP